MQQANLYASDRHGECMQTPWGELSSLDQTKRELAHKILRWDKHQLVEGMVAENAFDQLLQSVSDQTGDSLRILDIETYVCRSRGQSAELVVFVWARKKEKGLRACLNCLAKIAIVYLVELEEGAFVAAKWADSRRATAKTPLEEVVAQFGRWTDPTPVSSGVRDERRQNNAIWGFLDASLTVAQLWEQLALPRLLVNFGLEPYFASTWNLDRFCVFNDEVWMLELKHKFPIGTGNRFGLNEGELELMRLLSGSEIRIAHLIIVKPIWDGNAGSMYLFNQRELRDRAALIGVEMTPRQIKNAYSRPRKVSKLHTTLKGTGSIFYRELPTGIFSQLGLYGDTSVSLSSTLTRLLSGEKLPTTSVRWLRQLANMS
ncbi:hypothetical protein NTC87_07810 [Stenotrophomonas geniculata]|nr:hypothetical protein [Stenotrophomonas geniculata]MCR1805109.1 hypothetical protein [Stenotrophomonas geniculata]